MANETLEWLNENSQRAYPLQAFQNDKYQYGEAWNDQILLDAQINFEDGEPEQAFVDTLEVNISGDAIRITVTSSPSLESMTSSWIPITGPFPYYDRLSNGSLLVFGVGIVEIALYLGPGGNTAFDPPLYLLDSVCHHINKPWQGLDAIEFFNDSTSVSLSSGSFIQLESGYQFGVSQEERDILYFIADKNYGVPLLSCDFVDGTFCDGSVVSHITIVNGGVDYSVAPTITIESPPTGTQATATCTVSGGVINSVTITNPGSGYISNPIVTVTGTGTNASLAAVLNRSVRTINGISPDDAGLVWFHPSDRINILTDPDNYRIFVGLPYFSKDVCNLLIQ